MDVMLHRCVCVCVSQEGMEWMCCYTDVFVRVCVSGDVLLHRCVCLCVCLRREWNGCVRTLRRRNETASHLNCNTRLVQTSRYVLLRNVLFHFSLFQSSWHHSVEMPHIFCSLLNSPS